MAEIRHYQCDEVPEDLTPELARATLEAHQHIGFDRCLPYLIAGIVTSGGES